MTITISASTQQRWMRTSQLASLLLVCSLAPLSAATYYVSSSEGNDECSGKAPAAAGRTGPWKTLKRASTNYTGGDRLLLKCGDTSWTSDYAGR